MYIDKSGIFETFLLDKDTVEPYAHGYAHDEKGFYTYEVSERQFIHKEYRITEQECIDELYKEFLYILESHNQSLPDILGEPKKDFNPEKASREYIENVLSVNDEDRAYFETLCKSLGFEYLYDLIKVLTYEELVSKYSISDYYQEILSDIYAEIDYYFE